MQNELLGRNVTAYEDIVNITDFHDNKVYGRKQRKMGFIVYRDPQVTVLFSEHNPLSYRMVKYQTVDFDKYVSEKLFSVNRVSKSPYWTKYFSSKVSKLSLNELMVLQVR